MVDLPNNRGVDLLWSDPAVASEKLGFFRVVAPTVRACGAARTRACNEVRSRATRQGRRYRMTVEVALLLLGMDSQLVQRIATVLQQNY
jgi:hypothetical protein